MTATLPAFGAAGSTTNRRDIDKNGLITTADLGLVRASVVAGRFLRLITIPAAGSNAEGPLGSGGGNGGGSGGGGADRFVDGTGGGNDDSSLDGLAMMAPPFGLGAKTDNTRATYSGIPAACDPAPLLPAGASDFDAAGPLNAQEAKPSTDLGIEQGSRESAVDGTLDVSLSDDFFASFDDREIM